MILCVRMIDTKGVLLCGNVVSQCQIQFKGVPDLSCDGSDGIVRFSFLMRRKFYGQRTVGRSRLYKDKLQNWSAQGKDNNTYGFLGYPVLMAADIMLYKATCVPVGEDQSAHLELTREIVRRFNYLYNREVFPEPQAVFSKAKVLPGIDGRKMSKSYGNTIPFGAGPEEMWERIRMMTTDPPFSALFDAAGCIVFLRNRVCPYIFAHTRTDMRVFAQHIPCRKDWPLCLLRSLRSVPA